MSRLSNQASPLLRKLAAALALTIGIPASASAAPKGAIEQLATALGTPKLGSANQSQTSPVVMLEFIPSGDKIDAWTKIFTVNIIKVDRGQAGPKTLELIGRFHKLLTQNHANVGIYKVIGSGPAFCYFEFVQQGEINVGAIYSPDAGSVEIEQIAAHRAGVITTSDVAIFRKLGHYSP